MHNWSMCHSTAPKTSVTSKNCQTGLVLAHSHSEAVLISSRSPSISVCSKKRIKTCLKDGWLRIQVIYLIMMFWQTISTNCETLTNAAYLSCMMLTKAQVYIRAVKILKKCISTSSQSPKKQLNFVNLWRLFQLLSILRRILICLLTWFTLNTQNTRSLRKSTLAKIEKHHLLTQR